MNALETLFAATCLGRRKLVVMLTGFGSYCDEFGHPKDPKKHFMGICGLLAWSDKWIASSNTWRKVQTEEDIPNPFHMTDFVHHTEDFSDKRWESREERERILRLLLDVIGKAEAIPVSASVSLRDFNGLSEAQKKQLESPYHIAFQEVTFNIAFATANKALKTARQVEEFFGNRVARVYAKLQKFTGPAERLWDAIKEANPEAGHWMSSYTVGDPADYAPLQAADIWAYSLGHMQETHPSKRKTEAQIAFEFFVNRTFLTQTLGHSFVTFFDRSKLLSVLGELPEME